MTFDASYSELLAEGFQQAAMGGYDSRAMVSYQQGDADPE